MKALLLSLFVSFSLQSQASNCEVKDLNGKVLSESVENELYDCEIKCFSHALFNAYGKPLQCFYEGQEAPEFCPEEEGDFSFGGNYRYVYPLAQGCLVQSY